MDSDQDAKQLAILSSRRIPLAEFAVLCCVGTYPLPSTSVPLLAWSYWEGDSRGKLEKDQCAEAVKSCLAKGCIRVVDAPSIEEYKHIVNKEAAIGPIYGLPVVGDIDFTPAGATLWLSLDEQLWGTSRHYDFVYKVEVPGGEEWYCQSK